MNINRREALKSLAALPLVASGVAAPLAVGVDIAAGRTAVASMDSEGMQRSLEVLQGQIDKLYFVGKHGIYEFTKSGLRKCQP